MAADVTKKVRLTRDRARRLSRLAREMHATESDVLRQGLDLVDRVRRRRANVEGLIALAQGKEPPRIRFELK